MTERFSMQLSEIGCEFYGGKCSVQHLVIYLDNNKKLSDTEVVSLMNELDRKVRTLEEKLSSISAVNKL